MKNILIILAILLVSCNKTEINGNTYRKFTIKEGKHSSNHPILDVECDGNLQETWQLDFNCWHEPVTPSGQNKITGMTGVKIHEKSARLNWMPEFDTSGILRTFAYVYGADKSLYNVTDDGWTSIYLMNIEVEKDFDISIIALEDKWQFIISQDGKYKGAWIYADMPDTFFHTWFYFGGHATAPHTMSAYRLIE